MSEFLSVIRDLRKDMKQLVVSFSGLNKHFPTIKKAVEAMDKLQKTIEKNEPILEELVTEMQESNANIKTVLDILKAVKEEKKNVVTTP